MSRLYVDPPDTLPEANPAAPVADPPVPDLSRVDVVWLITHSRHANDEVLALLQALGARLPRRLQVSRIAFEDGGAGDAIPDAVAPEARLCAAVLVIERDALPTDALRYWVRWSTLQVARREDFRLFVCLYGLSTEEFHARAAGDELLGSLADVVHVADAPAEAVLREGLVPFLHQRDYLRQAEWWRAVQAPTSEALGWFAGAAQAGCVAVLVAAWIGKMLLGTELLVDALAGLGPEPAAIIAGAGAFPLYTVPLFMLVHGPGAIAGREHYNRLLRWGVPGLVTVQAATLVLLRAGAGAGPVLLGTLLGVILDAWRRAAPGARRARMSLEGALRLSSDPEPEGWWRQLAAGKPVHPLNAPLLPEPRPHVFISYTRRSAWSVRQATRLHDALAREGVRSFLDERSIGQGSSWRRALVRSIARVGVFAAVVDARTLRRPWIAAEWILALFGRDIAGAPLILVLRDPGMTDGDVAGALPVFRAVLEEGGRPGAGRPVVIDAAEESTPEALARLVATRHPRLAVFPAFATWLLDRASVPVLMLGSLGALPGLAGLIGFWQEQGGRYELTTPLAAAGTLPLAYVACAFWLAAILRLRAGDWFERGPGRRARGAVFDLAGALGLATLLVHWLPRVDFATAAWALAAGVASWMLNARLMARIADAPDAGS